MNVIKLLLLSIGSSVSALPSVAISSALFCGSGSLFCYLAKSERILEKICEMRIRMVEESDEYHRKHVTIFWKHICNQSNINPDSEDPSISPDSEDPPSELYSGIYNGLQAEFAKRRKIESTHLLKDIKKWVFCSPTVFRKKVRLWQYVLRGELFPEIYNSNVWREWADFEPYLLSAKINGSNIETSEPQESDQIVPFSSIAREM